MRRDWSRRSVLSGAAAAALAAAPSRAAEPPPRPPAGIQRFDPALDALVRPDAAMETVMEGFRWSEGPVWVGGRDGYLLVSDVPNNVIRRWSAREGASEFLRPSGYAGPPSPIFREPGSNGLILARGGLVAADCGNRGLARIDLRTRRKTMLCREFAGERFNSPNDLVLARDGSIYFTDPPYGLAGVADSPAREMDYTGVFRLAPDGTVSLIDRSLRMPNGIGLSPDGRTLYATAQGIGWVAWGLDAQGRPTERRTFVDGAATGIAGGDGLKVDTAGNLWASSRDGINVFTPEGRRIGLISTGGAVANCEFGADGYLYMSSAAKVVRVPVQARKLTV